MILPEEHAAAIGIRNAILLSLPLWGLIIAAVRYFA